MGQSTYKIAYVEQGKEQAWHDFWTGSGEKFEAAKLENADGALGLAEFVKAANLREAIRIVQRRYPGHTVMRGGSGRIG